MKQFTRLFRKFLETTQKRNATHSTNNANWTLSRLKDNAFGKYLLITNTLSSGFLMVAGDQMSQEIEYQRDNSKKRFDYERSAKMFVVGAIQGPINHFFYGWMDRVIKVVNLKNVSKKIVLDQLIMAPACIVAFFYSAGMLEGQSASACTDELKSKFLTIYRADWAVWPITQFINFYYLHPKYRVIYVNFVTMLYNVFLSYVKHDESYPVTTEM
ncbi:hypothetical protein HA402_014157 [Bradysia odoriphaga]|nr:hypothetical protein HA402_014157 [Bradysia odoriphaga]